MWSQGHTLTYPAHEKTWIDISLKVCIPVPAQISFAALLSCDQLSAVISEAEARARHGLFQPRPPRKDEEGAADV